MGVRLLSPPLAYRLNLICVKQLCAWDVTHERDLSPADSFGGKTPVGA